MGLDGELAIAWAAGFLDGEGSFRFIVIEKGGQRTAGVIRRKACISASQAVTSAPLDRLKILFGGTIHQVARPTVAGKIVWNWQINGGQQVRKALILLIPHLIVKRRDAEILLAHCETFRAQGQGGSQKLSLDVLSQRAALEAQLRR